MAVYDVNPTQLIIKVAERLKSEKEITPPNWAPFVKTGHNRERQPTQDDWWHIRAAAVLRKIHKLGPIGVSKLRVHYGGRKNRGHKPDRFALASGNIIRKVLQQLEAAGLASQAEKGVHKGRVTTPKGHKLLEEVARELLKENPLTVPEAAKAPKVQKKEAKSETKSEKAQEKAESLKKKAKKSASKSDTSKEKASSSKSKPKSKKKEREQKAEKTEKKPEQKIEQAEQKTEQKPEQGTEQKTEQKAEQTPEQKTEEKK
ncbi:30S ribosomal protein S19e [Candidatus Woesearchaeota archaeon]|nr:MAG: 30S ribosomal protein S19e [Candidatus Woesearchaeota archaeon]